jgi:hypothetical protein
MREPGGGRPLFLYSKFFRVSKSSSGFPRVLPGFQELFRVFQKFFRLSENAQWARKRAVRPVHKNITGINAPKERMNIAIWLESVIISA